jgi:hypothetical protein
MTGEPTAMQLAAAVPETARSELWRGASGDPLDLPGRARPQLDVGDPIAVEHCTAIQQPGEGGVQAVCSCGWRSAVFGSDKATGTMDPLQHAAEAADLHGWQMSLR